MSITLQRYKDMAWDFAQVNTRGMSELAKWYNAVPLADRNAAYAAAERALGTGLIGDFARAVATATSAGNLSISAERFESMSWDFANVRGGADLAKWIREVPTNELGAALDALKRELGQLPREVRTALVDLAGAKPEVANLLLARAGANPALTQPLFDLGLSMGGGQSITLDRFKNMAWDLAQVNGRGIDELAKWYLAVPMADRPAANQFAQNALGAGRMDQFNRAVATAVAAGNLTIPAKRFEDMAWDFVNVAKPEQLASWLLQVPAGAHRQAGVQALKNEFGGAVPAAVTDGVVRAVLQDASLRPRVVQLAIDALG